MVAWIGKTGGGFEQYLKLEQDILLVLDFEGLEPLIAGRALFLPQGACPTQQLVNADLDRQDTRTGPFRQEPVQYFSPNVAELASTPQGNSVASWPAALLQFCCYAERGYPVRTKQ